MDAMNKLSTTERARVIAALVEGNSIRATVRMTGIAKNTVAKLLVEIGAACADFADVTHRGIAAKQIQCDEIWAFCYAKAKNVPAEHQGEWGYGDVWTWTAIDPGSKFVISWLVAQRNASCAGMFMRDLGKRVTGRPQVSTDGLNAYKWAVYAGFDGKVDHAIIQKTFGTVDAGGGRYSPPVCTGITRDVGCGAPDLSHACTSHVERQNLTMRMSMRRFTRLTNGFSKKVENLEAAISLHFVHYNFCRPHISLDGRTPAQAVGLADHRWTLAELVGLLERKERAA
jgi:IS1 family transposase